MKEKSRFLRGTIADGLTHVETGAISEDDFQLLKFHGSYMQDDRDVRGERSKKKLDKAYMFMIRLRIPGGLVKPAQWRQLDDIAMTYAQPFAAHDDARDVPVSRRHQIEPQTHDAGDQRRLSRHDRGVRRRHSRRHVGRKSLPFEGSSAKPTSSRSGRSDHMLPKTGAYHEIWLDGEQIIGKETATPESEPIYGPRYLPRKFKFVFAVPPDNDVDVFAHDCGFIAIVENGKLVGWNVTVGGGMGMTHGVQETFPRLGDVLAFCTHDQVIDVAEKIVTVQRDWGNRSNRARARLKYTIEDRGLDNFRAEVEKRLGYPFGAPRPYKFERTGDFIGWRQGQDKKNGT